jgi:serine/threonine-protein kinase RIO1
MLRIVVVTLAALALACTPALAAHRLSPKSGAGKRAAQAALKAVKGGRVRMVTKDAAHPPSSRYNVVVAKSGKRYLVDVSESFKVTMVYAKAFGL